MSISSFKKKFISLFICLGVVTACACQVTTNAKPTAVNLDSKFELTSPADDKGKDKVGFNAGYLYWAVQQPPLATTWYIVFAGTVTEARKAEKRTEISGPTFTTGDIKVERVFLNIPVGGNSIDISPGMYFIGEGFDKLKKGDKVIVFINAFYENRYAYTGFGGRNTVPVIKVKNWDEPIINALEKSVRCDSTTESWVEGHKKDVTSKADACAGERDRRILSDKELMNVWRRYDPEGIKQVLEYEY